MWERGHVLPNYLKQILELWMVSPGASIRRNWQQLLIRSKFDFVAVLLMTCWLVFVWSCTRQCGGNTPNSDILYRTPHKTDIKWKLLNVSEYSARSQHRDIMRCTNDRLFPQTLQLVNLRQSILPTRYVSCTATIIFTRFKTSKSTADYMYHLL